MEMGDRMLIKWRDVVYEAVLKEISPSKEYHRLKIDFMITNPHIEQKVLTMWIKAKGYIVVEKMEIPKAHIPMGHIPPNSKVIR